MTYSEYENLIIIYRNSVAPETAMNANTIRYWYNIYFRFYDVEKFEKIIRSLIEQKIKPVLADILDEVKKFYGYLLHEEVNKAKEIIKQAKKENVPISERKYPKLKDKYSLPVAEAWEIAINQNVK